MVGHRNPYPVTVSRNIGDCVTAAAQNARVAPTRLRRAQLISVANEISKVYCRTVNVVLTLMIGQKRFYMSKVTPNVGRDRQGGTPNKAQGVRDQSRSAVAAVTMRELFRLTPTEARIAHALAHGKSIAEIASAHRASRETVRKQLKTVFAKTGTNRQAQCVSVLLRSGAGSAEE